MPLFECSECHSVDNTALTNFWETHMHDKPALCSACDPEIREWHGRFERLSMGEYANRFGKEAVRYRIVKALG